MKYNSQLDYLHMMCDYMQMGADAGLDNKGCLMARGKRERCLGQVTKLSASSWKFIKFCQFKHASDCLEICREMQCFAGIKYFGVMSQKH